MERTCQRFKKTPNQKALNLFKRAEAMKPPVYLDLSYIPPERGPFVPIKDISNIELYYVPQMLFKSYSELHSYEHLFVFHGEKIETQYRNADPDPNGPPVFGTITTGSLYGAVVFVYLPDRSKERCFEYLHQEQVLNLGRFYQELWKNASEEEIEKRNQLPKYYRITNPFFINKMFPEIK